MEAVQHRTISRGGKESRVAPWIVLMMVPVWAGCNEGTVTVRGHVLVDGRPVAGGRLSLNPIDTGPRAFSLVTEEGMFVLRASGGTSGAFPGQYHAFFQQPLDAATRLQLARELVGQVSVDELSLSYRSPKGEPIVIPKTGVEDLVIDIRTERGWTRQLND